MSKEEINVNFPVWIKAIAQVGFPIAVALFLLVSLYNKVVDIQTIVIAEAQKTTTLTNDSTVLLKTIKQICRNTAKTETQLAKCDE